MINYCYDNIQNVTASTTQETILHTEINRRQKVKFLDETNLSLLSFVLIIIYSEICDISCKQDNKI